MAWDGFGCAACKGTGENLANPGNAGQCHACGGTGSHLSPDNQQGVREALDLRFRALMIGEKPNWLKVQLNREPTTDEQAVIAKAIDAALAQSPANRGNGRVVIARDIAGLEKIINSEDMTRNIRIMPDGSVVNLDALAPNTPESAGTKSEGEHYLRFSEKTLASIRGECICGHKIEVSTDTPNRAAKFYAMVSEHCTGPSDPSPAFPGAGVREMIAAEFARKFPAVLGQYSQFKITDWFLSALSDRAGAEKT